MPKIKISRKTKIVMGILITVSVLSLVVLLFWSIWSNMFKQNSRFTMTRFTVVSANGSGWWHGKEQEVIRHLADFGGNPENKVELAEGKTNLFQVDLGKVRSRLEEVAEIEQVRARRILPNALEIQVVERTPAAVIGSSRSPFLADLNGVMLRRSRCLKIAGILPLIYGFKGPVPLPGKTFEQLKPAMEFVRLARTAYGELKIVMINVSARDYLAMRIYFKGNPADYYDVWVPVKNPELGMDRILTSIYEIKKLGVGRRNIDLRFDKQTILRSPAGAEK